MKILLTLILSFLLSCSTTIDKKNEPARLKGIPENAFWIGGVDGGNWYLIDYIDDHRNNAFIKVYNDNDGSLIISKSFMLICPSDNQTLIDDLKEQIQGFDGKKIFLKSPDEKAGCYLQ
jgi:hypothetical protein